MPPAEINSLYNPPKVRGINLHPFITIIPGLQKNGVHYMEQKHMEELPSDLQGKLLDGSENIYKAAFSSARRDGLNEEGARSVAWNTVSYAYAQGEDGCWHRKPDVSNISHKSVQSGGN